MKEQEIDGSVVERRIDRGDVYWIEPVGVPEGGVKEGTRREVVERVRHPHVVVQEDVFNHSRIETVVVCALTTRLQRASEPGNVLLEEGEGGLEARSVVVVSQVSSVEKVRLGAWIGRLTEARVEAIVDGLRFQQSFFRK